MDSDVDKPKTSSSILTSKINNGASGLDGPATGEGVDRRLQKQWLTKRRVLLGVGVAAFIALIAWGLSTTAGGRRYNVERDKLTVAEVVVGPFQENIAVSGNVLPRTTVYLDLPNGGRVQEVFALEGQQVEEGDPLLYLENNDLQLRLLSADAQRIEQRNRLEDMRFRMDQNALDLRQQLAQMNYNIQRLQRQHDRSLELFESGALSQAEYEVVRDELDYWVNNKDLTLQGYRQDSLRQVTQLQQMGTSVDRMQTNYDVLQRILENLTFRAPVTGQLTAFQAEVGEILGSGVRIGQIDVLDGFKVRAAVDEFYIARVQHGQGATTTVAGEDFLLRVTRVYPEVREGRFEVDLEFVDEQPPGIRRGQTIRSLLALSEPGEAVLVPRGGFFQSTGGQWAYVLTPDESEALRRPIRIGRQNTQHYEVLEGLEPGDRVITSSYDTFGDDTDRLVLK
jgi:HlyD family secretion protein